MQYNGNENEYTVPGYDPPGVNDYNQDSQSVRGGSDLFPQAAVQPGVNDDNQDSQSVRESSNPFPQAAVQPGVNDDNQNSQSVRESSDPFPQAAVQPGVNDDNQNSQSVRESSDTFPQAAVQPGMTNTPILDVSTPAPGAFFPGNARGNAENRVFSYGTNNWREPIYSQTHESTNNMYTPGICTDYPLPRKLSADTRQEKRSRERSGRPGRFLRAVCLLLVCVLFSGAAAYVVMDYRFKRGDFAVVNQVVIGGSTSTQQGGNLLSPVSTTGEAMPAEDIYDLARTHVVEIHTEMSGPGGSLWPQDTIAVVSGSGFIISSDGYILTNHHVIETSYTDNLPLMVYLSDGTKFEATVVGYESSNDFAIIKIDATGLNPAVIGDSDNIRVGQKVYAVGNPFGDLIYTMTEGIVSALDRVVTVESKSIDTFQFSAAVNRGNSGGPIYNERGEVIGIVTAKLMRDSVEGIGFAIPINDAIKIASELIEYGYITGRPLMGVTVETANTGLANYYDRVVGAFVKSVTQDSAAEKAGIAIGDIIIALGEAKIDSSDSLIYALRKYMAGDTTTITVWREGEEIELTITFDENLSAGQPQQRPQPQPQPPKQKDPEESTKP